ncbi:MAG: hypothetical protein PWQ09_981 [Candidatus Cloacimonadota bacterium]|jgi:hypothetical protein|nr:hypothetical protein [Candidatus Cloacimonadota bacterium]
MQFAFQLYKYAEYFKKKPLIRRFKEFIKQNQSKKNLEYCYLILQSVNKVVIFFVFPRWKQIFMTRYKLSPK